MHQAAESATFLQKYTNNNNNNGIPSFIKIFETIDSTTSVAATQFLSPMTTHQRSLESWRRSLTSQGVLLNFGAQKQEKSVPGFVGTWSKWYKERTLNKWHTSFTEYDRRTRTVTVYYRQNGSECTRNSTRTRQNRSECTRNSTRNITRKIIRPLRTCGWHNLLFFLFWIALSSSLRTSNMGDISNKVEGSYR